MDKFARISGESRACGNRRSIRPYVDSKLAALNERLTGMESNNTRLNKSIEGLWSTIDNLNMLVVNLEANDIRPYVDSKIESINKRHIAGMGAISTEITTSNKALENLTTKLETNLRRHDIEIVDQATRVVSLMDSIEPLKENQKNVVINIQMMSDQLGEHSRQISSLTQRLANKDSEDESTIRSFVGYMDDATKKHDVIVDRLNFDIPRIVKSIDILNAKVQDIETHLDI